MPTIMFRAFLIYEFANLLGKIFFTFVQKNIINKTKDSSGFRDSSLVLAKFEKNNELERCTVEPQSENSFDSKVEETPR